MSGQTRRSAAGRPHARGPGGSRRPCGHLRPGGPDLEVPLGHPADPGQGQFDRQGRQQALA
ncbi:MAG: hypothetical protein B7X31_14845 [Thiomonas sp. 13-66-29]|nr:MAG: hypothetical protein B7X46_03885 [Thiomonas sp. 15-66-11]OZB57673.1 MAG: hypothetical protein B7X31_14845 [Thiomonas sp. 13-66-29]